VGYARDRLRLLNIAIEKAMQTNPGMTNEQLQARFGCSKSLLTNIRRRIGIIAPFSEYVTDYDLKRGKPVTSVSDIAYRGICYGKGIRKYVAPPNRSNNN